MNRTQSLDFEEETKDIEKDWEADLEINQPLKLVIHQPKPQQLFLKRELELWSEKEEDELWDIDVNDLDLEAGSTTPLELIDTRSEGDRLSRCPSTDSITSNNQLKSPKLIRSSSIASIDSFGDGLESIPDNLTLKLKKRDNDFDSITDIDSLPDLDSIPDLETHSTDPKTRCNSKLDQYKELENDFEVDLALPVDGILQKQSIGTIGQGTSLQESEQIRTQDRKGVVPEPKSHQQTSKEQIASLLEKYKEKEQEFTEVKVVKKPMPLKKTLNTSRDCLARSRKPSTKPPIPIVKPTERKKPTYQVAFGRTIMEKPKAPKKPTLIQNLRSSHKPQVIGNMYYDPAQKRWTGNELEMRIFEADTKRVKPNLIKPENQPTRIGSMVFDPVNLRWTGNETIDEEAHLFDHIEALESQSTWYTEFTLEKPTMDQFLKSEVDHKLFVGNWYPKVLSDDRMVIRDTSKSHLYEIRTIALSRK